MEEFQRCREFIKLVDFSKLHVFPYSVRKGTKAALMPQVNDTVKKNRALNLIELSNELELNYANKFIGCELELIVEQKINEKEMVGHTSNFLSVILPLEEELISKNILIRIEKVEKNKIYGSIVNK